MTTRPTLVPLGTNGQVLLGTYDTEVLDSARWMQEMILGTNPTDRISPRAVEALPLTRESLLINGGFEYWTYLPTGTLSPNIGTYTKSATGWSLVNCGGDRSTDTEGSPYSLIATSNGPGQVLQRVVNAEPYRGQALSASVRAKGGTAYIVLFDDGGNVASGVAADTSSGWKTLIATYTVSTTATVITMAVVMPSAQVLNLDNANLVVSPGAVAYQPGQPYIENEKVESIHVTKNLSVRWRSRIDHEEMDISFQWPSPLVYDPVGAEYGLIFPGNPPTTDANMELESMTVSAIDRNGATVKVVARLANTDTYMYNLGVTARIDRAWLGG